MQQTLSGAREFKWVNISFFSATTLVALAGTPFYVSSFGLPLPVVLLALFYYAATGMAVTVGYHRLFAHLSYKAHPLVRFLLLFFGAAAFEQSALKWASQHRDHHRYVDTERDPYNIRQGFFYAHIGWMIYGQQSESFENVPDLQRDPMIRHQHRYYGLWAVTAGILTPLLIGAWMGHALGALIIAVCLRLTLVYHATFCINSVCHKFGGTPYDLRTSARDNWLVALATFGEGYHNFHHRFPNDYRNGARWFHWDPSKWMIWTLSRLRLTGGLRRVTPFRMLEAKLEVEHQKVKRRLEAIGPFPEQHPVREFFAARYQRLCRALHDWESAAMSRTHVFHKKMRGPSSEMQKTKAKCAREARRQFQEAYRHWLQARQSDLHELRRLIGSEAAASRNGA